MNAIRSCPMLAALLVPVIPMAACGTRQPAHPLLAAPMLQPRMAIVPNGAAFVIKDAGDPLDAVMSGPTPTISLGQGLHIDERLIAGLPLIKGDPHDAHH